MVANHFGGGRVKTAVSKFLSQNPAVFEELLTKHTDMLMLQDGI